MKIKNIIHIGKLFFMKDWYFEEYWDDNNPQYGSYKICKLKYHQIEGLLHWLKYFKEKKWYKLSDFIRNKLINVGYHWVDLKHKPFIRKMNKLIFQQNKHSFSLKGTIYETSGKPAWDTEINFVC